MSSIGQTVQVTLRLPKDVYERVTQAAVMEQRQVEDLLGALIAEGMETLNVSKLKIILAKLDCPLVNI